MCIHFYIFTEREELERKLKKLGDISRLLQMIGLFYRALLQKSPIKEEVATDARYVCVFMCQI